MRRKAEHDLVNCHSRDWWENQILQWVHNEVDLEMLRMQLLDGYTLYEITAEIQKIKNLEYDQVKKRTAKAKTQLFSHLARQGE